MIIHFKRSLVLILGLTLLIGCSKAPVDLVDEEAELRAKVAQLIQAERNNFTSTDALEIPLGSVLSGGGSRPMDDSIEGWKRMVSFYQEQLEIPLIYGVDAVHGHNNLKGATLFPHNIGLGAANNPELVRQIGIATGKEVKATGIHWNFSPTLAVVQDVRWGRAYESFSEDPQRVSALGLAYIQGLQSTGIAATAKHFLADGGTSFNTGSLGYLIDQGDAQLSEEELRRVHLFPYLSAINEGDVLTVMVSFSSVNGEKMHGSKYWISDVLKEELGFKGLVISDWEAIHQLEGSLYQQIVTAINAGVDMLMQPNNWKDSVDRLYRAVKNNDISMERIDDAIARINYVKAELGLFDDSFTPESADVVYSDTHKQLAREAVSQSLVLLKNNRNVLPLEKNTKILLIGPGSDNAGLANGGWTYSWQGESSGVNIPHATTLKMAFESVANEHQGMITTDLSKLNEVDVVVLALAELPYAEGVGDARDLSLSGHMMHPDNQAAIDFAKSINKPVITILTSGRPRVITNELNDWDAFVMAWLYGSEAQGITDVLYGDKNFSGTLPITWPKTSDTSTVSTQKADRDTSNVLFEYGFGLRYE